MRKYKDVKSYSKKQSNKMRFAGIVFLFFVLLTILISIWIVLDLMKDVKRFPLSKLIITGEYFHTHNIDVYRSILALGALDSFIKQDMKIIQNQIKCLPWIKQVSVRKQWPNKLNIHLVEYIPIACWNDHFMIDKEGNSFIIPDNNIYKKDLPTLHGPEGSEKEVLKGFLEIEKILSKYKFSLKEVEMTIRRSWKLTLKDNIKLNLGHDNVMKRLTRFVELYPILLQQIQITGKQINYIDLRYDSGAAVGWTSK